MRTADIILQQLGGRRFITFTGVKNLLSDGNTLRMTLPRNGSKANRLYITLEPDDTYTMRFFKYSPARLKVDHKNLTAKTIPDKTEDIKVYKGIYCDQLEELFTEVTKLYTRF